MDTPPQLRPLPDFRDALHLIFPQRGDTLLDLLDALSSNLSGQSPAELSLNPRFRRTYNSLYDGIQNFGVPAPASAQGMLPSFTRQLLDLIVPLLPVPQRRKFWLFGLDVTPTPDRSRAVWRIGRLSTGPIRLARISPSRWATLTRCWRRSPKRIRRPAHHGACRC